MTSFSIWVRRARKLFKGTVNPIYRKGLRYGVFPAIEHELAFTNRSFESVVDVGANKGQFALFARATFPNCRIISFEPIQSAADVYEKIFSGDAGTRLVRTAVGAARGSTNIHVTKHDDASSILKVGRAHEFGTSEIGHQEVPIGQLSDFLDKSDLGNRSLLKIDTQGYELEVLRGSEIILKSFSHIYCEVAFLELYKTQPLASEIIAYLHGQGYALAGVYGQAVAGSTPVQADMMFVRKTGPV